MNARDSNWPLLLERALLRIVAGASALTGVAFADEPDRSGYCTVFKPGVDGAVPPFVSFLDQAGLLTALLLCVLAVVYAFREREYVWLVVPPLSMVVALIGLIGSFVIVPHEARVNSVCGVKGDTMIPPTVYWPHFIDLAIIVFAPVVAAALVAFLRPSNWTTGYSS